MFTVGAHVQSSRKRILLLLTALLSHTVATGIGHGVSATRLAAHWVTVALAPLLLGLYLATRQRLVLSLRERAQRIERQKVLAEENARLGERRRIALEMHDVVAHGVTQMVVRAGTLQVLAESRGEGWVAREAAALHATGRTVLDELRTALGVLRVQGAEPEGPSRSPLPGIADLPLLLENARQNGTRVEYDQSGDLSLINPHHARAVYRVVQESLTNVAKHAPLARTRIDLDCRPGLLTVRVHNTAAPTPPTAMPHGRPRTHRHARASRDTRRQPARRAPSRRRFPGRGTASAAPGRTARNPRGARTVIRVVIADDEALIRDSLKMILDLQDDITVVGTAQDGSQAAAMARELTPDVVLLDIRMPGTDGLAVVHAVSSLPTLPRVVILTTFALDDYIDEAMRGGAVGFLLKDTPPNELIEAIRVIAHGSTVLSQAVTARAVAGRHRPAPASADQAKALARLTDRERHVLTLLAQGLSNQEIARTLHMSEGTVKGHVSRMMAKLGVANRVQAALIAHETGIDDPPAGDQEGSRW